MSHPTKTDLVEAVRHVGESLSIRITWEKADQIAASYKRESNKDDATSLRDYVEEYFS